MLGLTAAASVTDAVINKTIIGSGNHTVISNDYMRDLLKIIKSLANSVLLLEGITDTVKNEVKEQKAGFLSTLFSVLGSTLLSSMLSGKGVIRAGEGVNCAGYGSKKF